MIKVFYIRDDLGLAIDHYRQLNPDIDWDQKVTAFTNGLIKAFNMALPKNIEVHPVVFEFKLTSKHKTISMDTWVKGDYNISASRVFSLHDQKNALRIEARPGSEPLDVQLQKIPEGEYMLFDDDSATLAFPRHIASLLWPERKVVATHLLISSVLRADHQLVDVVDARDFLLGSLHGGLTVEVPSTKQAVRMPYWEPFVNLQQRASVVANKRNSFTQAVLKLNADFFEGTGARLECVPKPAAMLWEELGFSSKTQVEDVLTATWDTARLEEPVE